jgi:hypothetical protein
MSRISMKNSDALETVSISGQFSGLNIHSVRHWTGQRCPADEAAVFTISHVIVADVTSVRPLEVRIKEHKYNLTQGLLQKSKLVQHP